MGFDNEGLFSLVVDIETVTHSAAYDLVPPPDIEYLTPPGNYRKPESIAQWKEEEKARRILAREEEIARGALDPDLCRCVAIGSYDPRDPAPLVRLCRTEEEEAAALTELWERTRQATIVGYNLGHFDLPVLLRRSLLLRVKAPHFALSRYRASGVTDLFRVLNYDGLLTKMRSLDFYLRRFDITPIPDDIEGADIPQLVAEDQWDAVEHHCRADVLNTYRLAMRVGAILTDCRPL